MTNSLLVLKYINRTVNYYKNNGFICTVKRIWHSLGPFIYRQAIMYHKQLMGFDSEGTDNLKIKVASKEDIDERYEDIWYTKKQALEKLNKGHILLLSKDRDRNNFYGWVELSNINIPWLEIKELHIPENIGYISRFYVPPQYRRRLVAERALKFIEKYLSTNSTVDRVFCVTTPDNVASNRMATSCGYNPYQYIRYFKVIGLRLYLVESLEDKMLKLKKIFVQNPNFWNVFSSILS